MGHAIQQLKALIIIFQNDNMANNKKSNPQFDQYFCRLVEGI